MGTYCVNSTTFDALRPECVMQSEVVELVEKDNFRPPTRSD